MHHHKGIALLLILSVLSFLIVPTFNIFAQGVDQKVVYGKVYAGKIDRTYNIKYELLVEKFRGFSKKDITCLARNIYFESRNESILGQHSVAWVTLNRVKHKKWPNTVCEVVHQHKQFSWTIKNKHKRAYNKKAYKRALLIAQDTLEEYNNDGKDLSNGALYYHADYVKPIWRIRLLKIAQIDTHIFYKNHPK